MGFIINISGDLGITNCEADIDEVIEVVRVMVPMVYEDTREMHLALTKLEECEMWLERAKIRD